MVSPALSYHGRAGTLFYWNEELIENVTLDVIWILEKPQKTPVWPYYLLTNL